MNKPVNIYILVYNEPAGPYDTSIGIKHSVLMAACSIEDVKQSFKAFRPKANLVDINKDTRSVSLSGEVFQGLLQEYAPKFMRQIKEKAKQDEQLLKAGYQYNGKIIENQIKYDLLSGV